MGIYLNTNTDLTKLDEKFPLHNLDLKELLFCISCNWKKVITNEENIIASICFDTQEEREEVYKLLNISSDVICTSIRSASAHSYYPDLMIRGFSSGSYYADLIRRGLPADDYGVDFMHFVESKKRTNELKEEVCKKNIVLKDGVVLKYGAIKEIKELNLENREYYYTLEMYFKKKPTDDFFDCTVDELLARVLEDDNIVYLQINHWLLEKESRQVDNKSRERFLLSSIDYFVEQYPKTKRYFMNDDYEISKEEMKRDMSRWQIEVLNEGPIDYKIVHDISLSFNEFLKPDAEYTRSLLNNPKIKQLKDGLVLYFEWYMDIHFTSEVFLAI